MANGCIEKIDLEFIWWILHEGRTKEKLNHYKNIETEFKDKIVVLKKPKEVCLYLKKSGDDTNGFSNVRNE